MLEVLEQIDHIRLNFSDAGKLWLNIAIAFIMFGVALELKPSAFIDLLKRPKPVLVGILSQFVLMPLLTLLLTLTLSNLLTPTIALGMILVAACPGGNISNFISTLAKGNVALSVSLTAFSSVGGLLLTPFNFAFWGNLYLNITASTSSSELVRSLEIDPFSVLQTIALILGLPLFIGIVFSQKLPVLTSRIVIWTKRLSIVVFIALIVIIFSKNFDLFMEYIPYIFFIVLAHNALALLLGFQTARIFRLPKSDQKTIAIETGIQNSGLALALLFNPTIFPPEMAIGGMTFIAAWWGVWHIISGLTIASLWSGFKLSPG